MVVRCGLKIVVRVTVWHHEACQKVIQCDGIFNSLQTAIMDCFSCLHFFQQMHLGLNMHSFINFTLKHPFFSVKKYSIQPLRIRMAMTSDWLAESDVKTDIIPSKRRPDLTSCTSVMLHPHVRRHFIAPVSHVEIPVGYASIHDPQCFLL